MSMSSSSAGEGKPAWTVPSKRLLPVILEVSVMRPD